ncbi:Uu.00g142220.m01.CDS01 [Anthostomella pinea]|uniref:Uu.00g142220.m01.CDS01 n=1 Tax=Anthostomella pinea TaxID=933095 RepID=A0AAI8YJ57_9PEZI|nr:Uu.00g142220.m01.CDS01 [Anthostomella pinea]
MKKRSISPPPLRRPARRLQDAAPRFSQLGAPASGTLRVFSWNVNGIAPFVAPYLQASIRSFFKPSSSLFSAGRKRKRGPRDDEYSSTDDDVKRSGDGIDGRGRDLSLRGMEDPALAREGKASLRLALRRYGWPHILFLQEVKIKSGDARTMGAVRMAVNDGSRDLGRGSRYDDTDSGDEGSSRGDGGPGYDVHFNLPSDLYNAKGFGGKDFAQRYVERVRDVPWDREGRIQVIETRAVEFPPGTSSALPMDDKYPKDVPTDLELSGEPSPAATKFAIVNIYAVNGTDAQYRSTHTGALAGTRHDRKLAVHTELLRDAKALEAQGFAVVIAGDLNIARNARDGHPNLRTWPHQHVLNRIDFNDKFFTAKNVDVSSTKAMYATDSDSGLGLRRERGFDGIDTFRHVHGDERRYSYHGRGRKWGSSCDRVDLILASRSLARRVVDAGICDSPRDRGPSDHVPVWVEIGQPSAKGNSAI